MTTERDVKKLLKEWLDACGAYHFWPVQTGYGQATLDCIACIPADSDEGDVPEFWGIECKKEGVTEPTKRQAEIMKQMRDAGAVTWLVTAENGALRWIEQ